MRTVKLVWCLHLCWDLLSLRSPRSVLDHLHLHLKDVLAPARVPLVDVDDAPLGHDEGVADGLEVVPAVLVQGGGPHCLGGVAGSEASHAGDCQLDPEPVAVLPVSLHLDEVVQQASVLAGDGLQVEILLSECEPDGVE